MVPEVLKVHGDMEVDAKISKDTCLQISCFSANYRQLTRGQLGISLNQIHWLRNYTAGKLFRIGRFEYMLRPFRGTLTVYRHRDDGTVLALAPDGACYDEGGYEVDK